MIYFVPVIRLLYSETVLYVFGSSSVRQTDGFVVDVV